MDMTPRRPGDKATYVPSVWKELKHELKRPAVVGSCKPVQIGHLIH